MSSTKAGPIIAGMPTSATLTDEVKKTLIDVFGNWGARHLATQHPSTLLPELSGRFWGHNCLEIIVAVQSHLEQALQETLINFVTGELVQVGEADKFGMNLVFSDLPQIIIRAGVWGALTKHTHWLSTRRLIPQQDYLEQLFRDDLPHGMKLIIADYQRALESMDPVALDTTAFMTNEKAVALLPRCGGRVRHTPWDEPDYEAQVRKFLANRGGANHPRISRDDCTFSDRLSFTLDVAGNNITVTRSVVIESGKITGNHNTVDVIMPPDGTFADEGAGNRVRVRRWPWKTIAEELQIPQYL